MPARKLFSPSQLNVFETLPSDEINNTIAEHFGPRPAISLPDNPNALRTNLLRKVFAGWPMNCRPDSARPVLATTRDGLRLRGWDVPTQDHFWLRLCVLDKPACAARSVFLEVLDETGWTNWLGAMKSLFPPMTQPRGQVPPEWQSMLDLTCELPDSASQIVRRLQPGTGLAWFTPRGVGWDAWSGDENTHTQIRRRFMLLGQTRDGMRVWDIRCAMAALQLLNRPRLVEITLRGNGPMGVNALYAGLFEPSVKRLELRVLPSSHRDGPDYLNVLQVLDIPGALQLARQQMNLELSE